MPVPDRSDTICSSLSGRSTSYPNAGVNMNFTDVYSSNGVPENTQSHFLEAIPPVTAITQRNFNSNAAITFGSQNDLNNTMTIASTQDDSNVSDASDDGSDEDFRVVESLRESPLVSISKTKEW